MFEFKFDLFFIFLIASMTTSPIANRTYTDHWVIWNVGQGQWVTHVLSDSCQHYDAGGEVQAFKNIKNAVLHKCGNKLNKIFLSHWDLDHYNHISSLARSVRRLCWQIQAPPSSGNSYDISPSVARVMQLKIPLCPIDLTDSPIQSWQPKEGREKNDRSLVFKDERFLIPGDSPVDQEKKWVHDLKGLTSVKVLIVGHHGSRTSTSIELLKQLPNLKVAVVSARSRRYGHPHKSVTKRFSKNKTPILKTEDWGSIIFY